MEDELILADLGVVERRLERLERDLKKAQHAELRKEQEILLRCRDGARRRAAAARARARRATTRSGCAAFSSCRPSRCCSSSISTKPICRSADDAVELAGLESFLAGAATRAVPICAKIELEIAQLEPADAARVHGRSRPARIGARSRHSRQLRPARLHLVLHRRRGRMPRLVDSARHAGACSRRARFTATSRAASSAPKSCATSSCSRAARWPPAAITASCGSKARSTSSLDGDVINFRHAT